MKRGIIALLALCMGAMTNLAGEVPSEIEARQALRKAVTFFREQVSTEGGYLWKYDADLELREGEGKAGPTTVWVQPPGTPAVGMAMLEAWRLSGEPACLDGAVAAARALVRGQMKSGGWNYRIEFKPEDRARWAYREGQGVSRTARNTSVLDDDTTQSALRLMMRVDQALGFKDASIHEAGETALNALLAAQFGSGGFPQAFVGPVDAAGAPVKHATFPEQWSRSYPGHRNYWYQPTLNDNLLEDAINTLLEAGDIYNEETYRAAAFSAGRFLLLAQLPEPQPGWAQQYNQGMQPIWARKFEPPAVTGGESRGVLHTLLNLYERTGERIWLEPVPRALAYYRTCRLPDGKLARFYELETNKPLYFTREYRLTYDDSNTPTHYAFKINDWTGDVEARFRRLTARPWAAPQARERGRTRASEAARLIASLDDRGAWVEEGKLEFHRRDTRIIDCRTFNRNLPALAGYLEPSDNVPVSAR